MFERRSFKRFDWLLLLAVLGLSIFGLVMIYSATKAIASPGSIPPIQFVHKQMIWLFLGLVAFVFTVWIDYEKIVRWHIPLYIVSLLTLVAVLKVGHAPTGASSWFALGSFHLQPAEFTKITVILSLAAFIGRRVQAVTILPVVLKSLFIAGAPVLLVLVQPDLGTALVIIAIWFGALYVAGAKLPHLGIVFACGLILFSLAWNLDKLHLERVRPAPVGKLLAQTTLKPYQKRRLTIFLNPRADPLGAGYHVIQSRVAIGSGKFIGRGLFHGTQSRLHFIPERHTDFIFSVVGEELGLLGTGALLAVYFFIFWRGLRIAIRKPEPVGSLLAAGAISMLIFHTLVNVGMSLNIMPVTGLPLPFVSYGGSNLITAFIAFGLLQNVHMQRDNDILQMKELPTWGRGGGEKI